MRSNLNALNARERVGDSLAATRRKERKKSSSSANENALLITLQNLLDAPEEANWDHALFVLAN